MGMTIDTMPGVFGLTFDFLLKICFSILCPIRNSNLSIVSAYPPSGRNMVTFMPLKNSKLVMVTFVLNSILFPPISRNFAKTLNYKSIIYQNFSKTLNYETMIKLKIKTFVLPREKKSALQKSVP